MERLDLIVPIYNESQSISAFMNRLEKLAPILLQKFNLKLNVIFVNDGSEDNSIDEINKLDTIHASFTIQIVNLVRNFGSQAAISAGIFTSEAEFITIIPVDLQDPPELIPKMIETLKSDISVVFGARSERKDNLVNKITSRLYGYLFMPKNKEGIRVPTGSFISFKKDVKDQLIELTYINSPIYEKILWLQKKFSIVFYDRAARQFGNSKWNNSKRFKAGITAMFRKRGFLRNCSLIIVSIEFTIAFILFMYIIYSLFAGIEYNGWLSIITLITIFFGIQSLLLLILIEFAYTSQAERFPWFQIDKE